MNACGDFQVVQWFGIPCQCRAYGCDSWPGKTPHAVEQLSPGVTSTEPHTTSTETRARLEPVFHKKGSHCKEKSAYHTGEKPVCSNEDPVPPNVKKEMSVDAHSSVVHEAPG